MPAARRAAPVLALLGVTAIWGWTFVVVRDAVGHYPVSSFLALRFAVATICLAPWILARRRSLGRGFRRGLLPGVLLAAGYFAQTEGLRFTTASKAGLLTGLFVVFTPLLGVLLRRFRPNSITLMAVVVAFAGTALLVAPSGGHPLAHEAAGDSLEVLTAICFASHILLLSRFAPGSDAGGMALAQMAACAVLFAAGSGFSSGFPAPSLSVWIAIAITGVLASALAFWIQTLVQQRVSPARTAIILTCEPLFATVFGIALAGDSFTLLQALGGLLIATAVVGHETISGRRINLRAGAM